MARKKAIGKPLPKVKDDYVDPAPTADDVESLVVLWDLYAPAQYRGLLRAQNKSLLEQTGEKPKGRFVWDDKTHYYIEAQTGRVISRMELHRAYSAFTQAYANR